MDQRFNRTMQLGDIIKNHPINTIIEDHHEIEKMRSDYRNKTKEDLKAINKKGSGCLSLIIFIVIGIGTIFYFI